MTLRDTLHPRYCVTVTDNWTPLRKFWVRSRAARFYEEHRPASHFFVWRGRGWVETFNIKPRGRSMLTRLLVSVSIATACLGVFFVFVALVIAFPIQMALAIFSAAFVALAAGAYLMLEENGF